MNQYCYSSLVLATKGSVTKLREGFMLDVSFLLKFIEIRNMKSVIIVCFSACRDTEM